MKTHKEFIGTQVEIPVHYDLWMRGARYGTVTGFRYGKDGISDSLLVKMDHPQVKRRVRIWKQDWPFLKIC